MLDYLVVGAGLFGATCARILADAGKSVEVIDQRGYIGGNCYDEPHDNYFVCKHGGHIFHTSNESIWKFVNKYARFIPYEHRVRAWADNRFLSLPVNLHTLYTLFGVETPISARQLMQNPKYHKRLRDLLFVGYSEKQWGVPYNKIPKEIINRLPIRYTMDDRYFMDRWQGIPEDGYTNMFQRMLKGIQVELNTPFHDIDSSLKVLAKKIIYSGEIDRLFKYSLGPLTYRSLRFEEHTIKGDYQGCATINYPDKEIPYNRVLEYKHYGWKQSESSVYHFVFPIKYQNIMVSDIPYYPFPDSENLERYKQYLYLLEGYPNVIVGGRLGSYKYLNMDETIGQAISKSLSELKHR